MFWQTNEEEEMPRGSSLLDARGPFLFRSVHAVIAL